MSEENVRATLEEAVNSLFESQPNIFDFTSATNQTEWYLARHLAVEIHKAFPGFDCDVDVAKVNYDYRRPDIIIHSRGTHRNNYLVVEVKRDGGGADIARDVEKVAENWFRPPLQYRFGAVVNLRTDGQHQIQVFMNGG